MAIANITSSTTTSMHTPNILELRTPYLSKPRGCHYKDDAVIIAKPLEIGTNIFIGSSTSVSMHSSERSILYDAPGCLAAPVVNLIAQQSIRLGSHERSPYSPFKPPLRLFAANILHIKTEHLVIGNIQLLVQPYTATIICSRLTIINFSEEATNSLLPMIKKWLDNPATTHIEVFPPTLQPNLLESDLMQSE